MSDEAEHLKANVTWTKGEASPDGLTIYTGYADTATSESGGVVHDIEPIEFSFAWTDIQPPPHHSPPGPHSPFKKAEDNHES
ncbi:MAG TPA: hypothetical protein VGE45_15495 [Chloroflexia bacterium]|jgi:hypothetical protein